MGNLKFRLSDLLKYIFLGGFEFVLFVLSCIEESVKVFNTLLEYPSPIQTAILFTILAFLYLLGYITQSLIQLAFRGNLLGTGIGEVAEYIKNYPRCIFNNRHYPNWLYWSDSPQSVINDYKEYLETSESSEIQTEFLQTNQLFQGISLVLIIYSIYISFDSWERYILIIACLITLGLLSIYFCKGKIIIITKFFAIIIPILLLIPSKNIPFLVRVLIVLSIYLFIFIASLLARQQITRIDILANKNNQEYDKFKTILKKYGIPKVFVLIRTNTHQYLDEALNSIKTQDYPNIKVIILIDSNIKNNSSIEQIDKIISSDDYSCLNISFYQSNNSGAAALAYEIRTLFLHFANEDDYAVMLDSDDKFNKTSYVISNIVTKMEMTESNICLIRFEIFGKKHLNYSKNYHNKLIKRISCNCKIGKTKNGNRRDWILPKLLCKLGEAYHKLIKRISCNCNIGKTKNTQLPKTGNRRDWISPKLLCKLDEAHHVSTIGWVKCYKKTILEEYHRLLKNYSNDFSQYTKYEDFPDINALLLKNSKICAVGKNSIMFRKHENTVTTNVSPDNYKKMIPYFLWLSKDIAYRHTDQLVPEATDAIINKLIPYKFTQYYSTIRNIRNSNESLKNYSQTKFFNDFIKFVFEDSDRPMFLEHLKILLNNENEVEILEIDNDCKKELLRLIDSTELPKV